MDSYKISFDDITTAAIVAGRYFSSEAHPSEWEECCRRIDAFAAARRLPLVMVMAQDMLDSFNYDQTLNTSAIVGLRVAVTKEPTPTRIELGAMREALERAQSVPWDEIRDLLPDRGNDRERFQREETQCWAASAGPLAGVLVAFGVPAKQDPWEEEPVEPGSPQTELPDLSFVAGKNMDQEREEQGIWGVRVAYGGDWEPKALDLGDAAHEARVAELGVLAPRAGYYFMTVYD